MSRTPSRHQHAANVLGALSLVVADRMNTAIEAVASLGPSAPAALAAMREFLDGGSVTQLSSVLGLTHSGTVRLVDRLAAEGLVERTATQDARAVAVVLTQQGRDTAEQVLQARENSLTNTLSALSPAELDNLTAALDTMLAALTRARAAERSTHPKPRPQPWLCRLCDFTACGRTEGKCPVNNALCDQQ